MPSDLAFYPLAGLTLAAAIAAMTLRNLVHCALSAAAAFAGLALIYLDLNAEFVGFAQILVYVGAIAILIVFTVLLTRGTDIKTGVSAIAQGWLASITVAGLMLGCLVLPILMSPSMRRLAPPPAAAPVKNIGQELMTRYALPLETVGLLLTAALVGAVIIAMDETRPVPPKTERTSARRKPQLEESPR
jgi:NADH-quinone oxidoreductase subunit J